MIFDRLANEHPETCTWKQQEIPCSSIRDHLLGAMLWFCPEKLLDACFANPVENCFIKNTMTLTNLKLNKKSETPNLQVMI